MDEQRTQSRKRQLKDQTFEKERRKVSVNKLRIFFAVLVTALTVAALGVAPMQSTAQANSYDDSFDAIARRNGYYRAFIAATANSHDDSFDAIARRNGYYRAFIAAAANSHDDSFDAIARRNGYYRAFMAATTTGDDLTTREALSQ